MSRPVNKENLMSLADQIIWGMQTYGARFCFDSFQFRLLWWDDFLGDQLRDEWRSTGDVGGSAAVVDAQTGGIVRITTNNVDTENWRIDWNTIRSLHMNQEITMEVRVKLTQTTNMHVRLRLYFDDNNFINFRYDSPVGANWLIESRDDGVATTTADSGIAADTDYHILRIECFPAGAVRFYIDGTECNNSPITTNTPNDAADFLQPWLYIRTRENAAKSMDIDYIVVRQNR